MSKILLLVPEALLHEQFENCTVVPLRSSGQTFADLQQAGAIATDFVAATYATDAGSVRLMLTQLAAMERTERRLVYSGNAIPMDLRTAFPKPLLALLQRILPCDLICVSASVAQQATGSETMIQSVLGGELETEFVPGTPSLARFPDAGPGNNGSGRGMSGVALTSAIDRALASLKLSSPERMCVTAGILLLWDFLTESHEISQTMEGNGTPKTADYWHGIMHRREPDAGNAAFWFRKVGSHPAFVSLALNLDYWMTETGASDDERTLAQRKLTPKGTFDPFAMIELSTMAIRKPGGLEDRTLRRVQYLEILNLLSWSVQRNY